MKRQVPFLPDVRDLRGSSRRPPWESGVDDILGSLVHGFRGIDQNHTMRDVLESLGWPQENLLFSSQRNADHRQGNVLVEPKQSERVQSEALGNMVNSRMPTSNNPTALDRSSSWDHTVTPFPVGSHQLPIIPKAESSHHLGGNEHKPTSYIEYGGGLSCNINNIPGAVGTFQTDSDPVQMNMSAHSNYNRVGGVNYDHAGGYYNDNSTANHRNCPSSNVGGIGMLPNGFQTTALEAEVQRINATQSYCMGAGNHGYYSEPTTLNHDINPFGFSNGAAMMPAPDASFQMNHHPTLQMNGMGPSHQSSYYMQGGNDRGYRPPTTRNHAINPSLCGAITTTPNIDATFQIDDHQTQQIRTMPTHRSFSNDHGYWKPATHNQDGNYPAGTPIMPLNTMMPAEDFAVGSAFTCNTQEGFDVHRSHNNDLADHPLPVAPRTESTSVTRSDDLVISNLDDIFNQLDGDESQDLVLLLHGKGSFINDDGDDDTDQVAVELPPPADTDETKPPQVVAAVAAVAAAAEGVEDQVQHVQETINRPRRTLGDLGELYHCEPVFLFKKKLTKSDMDTSQCRLLIPKRDVDKQFKPPIFTEEDVVRFTEGMEVTVYDENWESYEMIFKYWNNSAKTYNLQGKWKEFMHKNEMKTGDELCGYGFRSADEIGVMIKINE